MEKKIKHLMSDELLSFSELKSDNLYAQIDEDKKMIYIKEAMYLGRTTAEQVRKEHPYKSILEMCEEAGIKVTYSDNKQRLTSLKIRAEYFHYEKKLTIYQHSIDTMFLQLNKIIDISRETIIDIHLAHEFFHHLEYEMIGLVNETLPPIQLRGILGIGRQATVVQSREIAAHMFCKVLMNLDFHPRYIDYMYLLANQDVTETQLIRYFEKTKKEFNELKKGC